MVIVQAPPGSSLAYTTRFGRRGAGHHQPESRYGRSVFGHGLQLLRQRVQRGMMFVSTKPSDQRRGKGHSTADIVADLSPKLKSLMFAPNGGLVAMFQPPAVNGVGSFGGFQFMLQDQGSNTLSRPGPRGAPDCGRKPPAQGPDRPADHLLRQRSAGAGDHRSREGQGDERSALADHHHAQRLHGLGIHQRLRLTTTAPIASLCRPISPSA